MGIRGFIVPGAVVRKVIREGPIIIAAVKPVIMEKALQPILFFMA